MRGQFDVVATYQVNAEHGVAQRLAQRGMIPAGSTRVLWTSPLIPASPFSTRANLPQGLKDDFVAAMNAMKESVQWVSAAEQDPENVYKMKAFEAFSSLLDTIRQSSVDFNVPQIMLGAPVLETERKIAKAA